MSSSDRGHLTRRDFLKYSLSAGVIVWAGARLPEAQARSLFSINKDRPPEQVFPQSVASGDPAPDGIVLWTRIEPKLVPGGERRRGVRVAYEVSAEASFRRPLLRGVAETGPGRDHTVKVQLRRRELRPFTTYYYRFIFAGTASRTGRFKTLPAAGATLKSLRLGYTSCQDYTNGYYNALRYLADEELDCVVHLGDYIYETVSDESFQGGGPPERRFTLPGGGSRAESLSDYRFLYKKYKTDRDLQRLHERHAVISIWDDHEFANDCYRTYDTDTTDEQRNNDPRRRQAANRAWAEYIPAGVPYDPQEGPLEELRIYRSFRFGDLAELFMTDERLYRDGPPCGLATTDRYLTAGCGAEKSPERTMLGSRQRKWFLDGVGNSTRRWKIWGNETMVMQLKLLNTYASLFKGATLPVSGDATAALPQQVPPDGLYVNLDQWDGYQAERAEIARALRGAGVKNFVVITGDLHSYAAGYLREDFDSLAPPQTDAVGVCFMAGSVTSSNLLELAARTGNQTPSYTDISAALKASNPHLEFFNSDTHGYNVLEVTPGQLTCTMKAVNTIRKPQAALNTVRSFKVLSGETLIRPAL